MEEIESIHENCNKLLEIFRKNLEDDSNIIEKYQTNPPNVNNSGYNILFNDLERNILFSETLLTEVDEIIQKLEQLKVYANMRIEIDTTVGKSINKRIEIPSLQTYSEESTHQNVDITQLPDEQKEIAENLLELQKHREKKGGRSMRKKKAVKKISKKKLKKNNRL